MLFHVYNTSLLRKGDDFLVLVKSHTLHSKMEQLVFFAKQPISEGVEYGVIGGGAFVVFGNHMCSTSSVRVF